jgi:hypothetical protein
MQLTLVSLHTTFPVLVHFLAMHLSLLALVLFSFMHCCGQVGTTFLTNGGILTIVISGFLFSIKDMLTFAFVIWLLAFLLTLLIVRSAIKNLFVVSVNEKEATGALDKNNDLVSMSSKLKN